MSSQMKGLIGVTMALLAFFSYGVAEVVNVTPYYLSFMSVILFLFAVVAIFLGVWARKGGARIWGISSITLGVVAAVFHILGILQFASK